MSELVNNTEPELSFEKRFKRMVDKIRPYIKAIWKARWKIVIINGIVLIVSLAVLLFIVKPYYTSTVTILPDYGSKETSLGQLSSLASLAGVNVGSGSPTDIYQNLIMSESVLGPVIMAKYKTKEYPDPVNLIQYYEIEPDKDLASDLQGRDMFIKEFKKFTKNVLTTDVDRLTKILSISAKMPEAKLSADVVNKIAESLDQYIRTKRRSYASEQRQYIEKRLSQIKDSLSLAENSLTIFKEQNRVISQSPSLMLEQTRLARNVEILSSVFLELSKQLELAKIDEIKDTPVVNLKEEAGNPIIKTGPKRLDILIAVLFLSFIFTLSYFAFQNIFRKYYDYIKSANYS